MHETETATEMYEFGCLKIGVAEMEGRRDAMEDFHVVAELKLDYVLLVLFDGHGGVEAPVFAKFHFVEVLKSTTHWIEYARQIDGGAKGDEALLAASLEKTFEVIDATMRKSKDMASVSCGCTAVACLITPRYIVCANAGDSRAVLGTENSSVKALSYDHKPLSPLERDRIEEAGGCVLDCGGIGRINGSLAVSRGLGDFKYKQNKDPDDPQGFHRTIQMVSCIPDITIHDRSAEDDVILIACDGLWDVMSNEDAVRIARELFKTDRCTASMAEELILEAYARNSTDNISAILVKLSGAEIETPKDSGTPAIREDRQDYLTAPRPVFRLRQQSIEHAPGSVFESVDY